MARSPEISEVPPERVGEHEYGCRQTPEQPFPVYFRTQRRAKRKKDPSGGGEAAAAGECWRAASCTSQREPNASPRASQGEPDAAHDGARLPPPSTSSLAPRKETILVDLNALSEQLGNPRLTLNQLKVSKDDAAVAFTVDPGDGSERAMGFVTLLPTPGQREHNPSAHPPAHAHAHAPQPGDRSRSGSDPSWSCLRVPALDGSVGFEWAGDASNGLFCTQADSLGRPAELWWVDVPAPAKAALHTPSGGTDARDGTDRETESASHPGASTPHADHGAWRAPHDGTSPSPFLSSPSSPSLLSSLRSLFGVPGTGSPLDQPLADPFSPAASAAPPLPSRLLYREPDERVYLDVSATKDWEYVILHAHAKTVSEMRVWKVPERGASPGGAGAGGAGGVKPSATPPSFSDFLPLVSRTNRVEAFAEHAQGTFWILSNATRDDGQYGLQAVADADVSRGMAAWQTVDISAVEAGQGMRENVKGMIHGERPGDDERRGETPADATGQGSPAARALLTSLSGPATALPRAAPSGPATSAPFLPCAFDDLEAFECGLVLHGRDAAARPAIAILEFAPSPPAPRAPPAHPAPPSARIADAYRVPLPEPFSAASPGANAWFGAPSVRATLSSPAVPDVAADWSFKRRTWKRIPQGLAQAGPAGTPVEEADDAEAGVHYDGREAEPQSESGDRDKMNENGSSSAAAAQPPTLAPTSAARAAPPPPLTLWARSRADGARIPVTLFRPSLPAKHAPCLVEVYGAYGQSLDADWRAERAELLERGWAIALAHVRGGGEGGRRWRAEGAGTAGRAARRAADLRAACELLVGLQNDVGVAEGLRETGAAPEGRAGRPLARSPPPPHAGALVILASSAGGVPAAGVLASLAREEAMRLHGSSEPVLSETGSPDAPAGRLLARLAGLVLESPFLDLRGALTRPELPLTIHEYDEWGCPDDEDFWTHIDDLCPYTGMLRARAELCGARDVASTSPGAGCGRGARADRSGLGGRASPLEPSSSAPELVSLPSVLVTASPTDSRVELAGTVKWVLATRDVLGRLSAAEGAAAGAGDEAAPACTVPAVLLDPHAHEGHMAHDADVPRLRAAQLAFATKALGRWGRARSERRP